MEFNIEQNRPNNREKYSENELETAYELAKKVHKEFETFVRAMVLFGSAARRVENRTLSEDSVNEETGQPAVHDIDILLVIDDVSVQLTKELVQTYRVILEKVVRETSDRLHVITLKFTSFWEYVRSGDPVAVNVLRDGVPIIDTGFFEPLQLLLVQGRIRPSAESVWSYYSKAPLTLKNSQWHMKQAVVDLYWAVIDSAHAALMKLNEVPPSPEHVADVLKEKLIRPGVLEPRHAKTMSRFYDLMKGITHGDIKEIKGEHFDQYFKEAEKFVSDIETFLKK